jgi:hypothetical protein
MCKWTEFTCCCSWRVPDPRTRRDRVEIRESHWRIQMDDLATAYIEWKKGYSGTTYLRYEPGQDEVEEMAQSDCNSELTRFSLVVTDAFSEYLQCTKRLYSTTGMNTH